MATNVAGIPTPFNRDPSDFVREPHDVKIRRVMGAAYARLAASGEKVKRALSVHHSAVSHRKSGSGPLANAAVELDALERSGIDTDPLFTALDRVRLAARPAIDPVAQTRSESEADAAEDVAAAEFYTGVPGARERWAEALLRQAAESKRLAQALLAGGGR